MSYQRPEIKISADKPPVYDRVKDAFGADWDDGLIITYGDTIHVKGGVGLTKDLIAHEAVHVGQQTLYPGGVDAWWDRYLVDKDFRLSQEQEAYGVQLVVIRDEVNNKRKRLARIATIVHSLYTFYGDMMTKDEANDWVISVLDEQ